MVPQGMTESARKQMGLGYRKGVFRYFWTDQ